MPFYPHLRDLPKEKRKRAASGLLRLKRAFSTEGLPEKRVDGNLLLATWNIREFGGEKFGGRDDESLYYIAEIISRFDLVAIQEVRDDIADLNRVMRTLGSWWKVLYTDVTAGRRGNQERTGFLYDSRKVIFGGLAGEIVLPPLETGETTTAVEQIARTPMIVGFRAGWFKFTVCTAYLFYGEEKPDDPRRLQEMRDLAKFLRSAAANKNAWAKNMIVLGDFNIFQTEDKTFKALTENGFTVPPGILKLTSNLAGGKHYDQISFIAPTVMDHWRAPPQASLTFRNMFIATKTNPITRPISARPNTNRGAPTSFPTTCRSGVELKTDFGENYLAELAKP